LNQWRTFVPESGDLALLGGARCAVDIPDAFLFIVIGRVLSAGQVEVPGPSRAELRATGERERSDLSPTRQSRGQEGWRRRLPDSRSGSWCVRHRRTRSVRAAQRQNRHGCGLSYRHTSGLGGAIRDACQRGRISRIERRLLGWKLSDEHIVRGGGHGGLRRGARLRQPAHGIRFIAAINGIERVMNRRVRLGENA